MKEVELARERERVESCSLLCHMIGIATLVAMVLSGNSFGGSKY